MDVIEFLTARLDEDEQVARVAGERSAAGVGKGRPGGASPGALWTYGMWTHLDEHVVHYDPARVLAEVAAKRAVIANAEDGWSDDQGCDASMIAVKALARAYADHPGYAPRWDE